MSTQKSKLLRCEHTDNTTKVNSIRSVSSIAYHTYILQTHRLHLQYFGYTGIFERFKNTISEDSLLMNSYNSSLIHYNLKI